MHLELTNPQGISFDKGGHKGFYKAIYTTDCKNHEVRGETIDDAHGIHVAHTVRTVIKRTSQAREASSSRQP
jgi:hypothetical protein